MLPERDRSLLEGVVHDIVGEAARIEWEPPGAGWSARVRLVGATGLVAHLLISPEWQEARFEAPRSSAFVLTTAEEDDVRGALTKLARAAVEYVAGRGRVEQARGLVGRRAVLVLRTVDGEWRIGRRTSDLRP